MSIYDLSCGVTEILEFGQGPWFSIPKMAQDSVCVSWSKSRSKQIQVARHTSTLPGTPPSASLVRLPRHQLSNRVPLYNSSSILARDPWLDARLHGNNNLISPCGVQCCEQCADSPTDTKASNESPFTKNVTQLRLVSFMSLTLVWRDQPRRLSA